eukprot:scaffold301_cov243-Pinguiococcus_pyrenoidosus.AAC.9
MVYQRSASEYWLYYSSGTAHATGASEQPVRCIGLARGAGNAPEINWSSEDKPLFCTHHFNGAFAPQAAAPHVFSSQDGRLYMVFGSGGGGVYGLELDGTTGYPVGKLSSCPDTFLFPMEREGADKAAFFQGTNDSVWFLDGEDSLITLLARSTEMGDVNYGDSTKPSSEGQDGAGYRQVMLIDSPAVLWKEAASGTTTYYYLFATFGTQYRGVYSDAQIRMGRSESPLGPYTSNSGLPMESGDAELFIDTPSEDRSREDLYENRFVGPGKIGFTTGEAGDPLAVTYRFYDARGYGETSGRSKCYVPVYCDSYGTIGGSLVDWSESDWPFVRSNPWDPGNYGGDADRPRGCSNVLARDSVAADCDEVSTSLSDEDIQFLVVISIFVSAAAFIYLMLEAYVNYQRRRRDTDIANPKWWEASFQVSACLMITYCTCSQAASLMLGS